MRNVVFEVSSIRDTFKSLLHNKTQAKFVDLLRPILEDLNADIEILIFILDEHMGVGSEFTVRILPAVVRSSWDSFCSLFYGSSKSVSVGSAISSDNMISSPRVLSSRFHEIDINGDVEKKDHRYIEHNSKDHKIKNMINLIHK